MVTRKRKIETEQDRFGGFKEDVSSRRNVFVTPDTIEIPDGGRMFGRAETRRKEELYSGRTTERAFSQQETLRPAKKSSLSEEDLMPSIKTMSYAEHKKKADTREALEGKTKMMLAIYMIVVVLLAAIVIGTGIVINSLNASIGRLDQEIEKSKLVISSQSEDLFRVNSSDNIVAAAAEKDMVPVDSVTQMELIPFVEERSVVFQESLFDKFCDWLQGILGN